MATKDIELILKDVPISFVHVFNPQEFTDEKTGQKRWTYNLNALIPKKIDGKKNPMSTSISDAVKTAIANTWPGQNKVIPPERRCFRDGEPIDPDTADPDIAGSGTRVPLYDGYEGMNFLSANRSVTGPDAPNPVQILGPKKTAIGPDGKPAFPRLKESDGLIYGGCNCDLIVRIYGYDGKGKNPDRVNCSLEAVKFRRHGKPFGAKPVDADNLFEEDDDDDFDAPTTKAPALDEDDI